MYAKFTKTLVLKHCCCTTTMENSIKMYLLQTWAQFRMILYHWGSIPYFIIFTIINYLLIGFQKFFWWRLTGVNAHLHEIYLGNCYETSAHVLTVLANGKETEFDKARDNLHFIKVHHSFQHPEIVLSDDIILMDVTYKKAIFVQLPHSCVHYTVKNVPFMFITVVKDALKLIEMPLDSFHKLADKVGQPEKSYDRITFLFHAGRCGSTAIARVVEELDPNSIVFSEPPCMIEFSNYMKFAPKSFSYPALRSMLYLLLKPISGKKSIVVKPLYINSLIANYIHDILPNAKCFYLTRDPIRIVWGQERAFGLSPTYKFTQFLMYSKLYPHIERTLPHYRNPIFEHFTLRHLNCTSFEWCFCVWVQSYINYKVHAEMFEFPMINYDMMVENPEKFCRKLAKILNIPETSSSLNAASVLDKDAQDGTVLCQAYLRYIPVTPYSTELQERTDKFCESMQLPKLNWEPYRKRTAYQR